jgi:hypothetical protein
MYIYTHTNSINEEWKAINSQGAPVYTRPDESADIVGHLKCLDTVTVDVHAGLWLQIRDCTGQYWVRAAGSDERVLMIQIGKTLLSDPEAGKGMLVRVPALRPVQDCLGRWKVIAERGAVVFGSPGGTPTGKVGACMCMCMRMCMCMCMQTGGTPTGKLVHVCVCVCVCVCRSMYKKCVCMRVSVFLVRVEAHDVQEGWE